MKNKRIKSGIIIIVFAFMLVLSLFAGQGVTPAFAETSNFSSVLADLQKDSNFNFADYPENSKDYSIQVIQIAESETEYSSACCNTNQSVTVRNGRRNKNLRFKAGQHLGRIL